MYLYLIRCGSRGPIKIGVAKNVEKRLYDLQCGCPYELSILAKFQCGSKAKAYDLENRLHKLYDRQRMQREWFKGNINLKKASDLFNLSDLDEAKQKEHIDSELDLQLLASSPI